MRFRLHSTYVRLHCYLPYTKCENILNLPCYVRVIQQVKLKHSLYRPKGWVTGRLGSQISRKSVKNLVRLSAHATDSFTPSLATGDIPGTDFCSRLIRPQDHSAVVSTPSAIEPATFRLVAQCSKQLLHFMPPPALFRARIKFFCRLLDEFS